MSQAERRSAARLAAVQTLYKMELTGSGVAEALAEFEAHWIGQELEGDEYHQAEEGFFRDLVGGVVREQRRIDPLVDTTLSDGWPLKRVDAIMRSILRAGTYELIGRPDVPPRVIIKEYVDVAHAFLDKDEAGMINAVLDRLARAERAGDLRGKD